MDGFRYDATTMSDENDLADDLLRMAWEIQAGRVPPFSQGETATVGAFDLLLARLQPSQAFELLTAICSREERLAEEGLNDGLAWLMRELVPSTATTQVPPGMKELLNRRRQEIAFDEIRRWYRL